MKKNPMTLESIFSGVGKQFIKIHLQGFLSRKPKKIMRHTNQVLRFYRGDTHRDLFECLAGTILTWRQVMVSNIPQRECKKIERAVVRSFNYLLNMIDIENIEIVRYLRGETNPSHSLCEGQGDPFRTLLNLKLTECSIRFENISEVLKHAKEIYWRAGFEKISQKFRLRIPPLK